MGAGSMVDIASGPAWTSTRRRSPLAVAEGVRDGEVRALGIFPSRVEVVAKLAGRLAGAGRELSFRYEAGPCGWPAAAARGPRPRCWVAPSLIPTQPGDRVKTDRRDALCLAKLHRAGELTAVWVPDAAHEAMRDLVRARATAVQVLGKARQHLQGSCFVTAASMPAGRRGPWPIGGG